MHFGAGSQTEGDQRFAEAIGNACVGRHEVRKLLSKNFAWASGIGTKELPDGEQQGDMLAHTGKISHLSRLAAMDAPSLLTTERTAGFE